MKGSPDGSLPLDSQPTVSFAQGGFAGFNPHSWRVFNQALLTTGIRKENPAGSARRTLRWLGYSPRPAISEVFDCVTSPAKNVPWDLRIERYSR